jgi:hypothetical protein
MFSAAVTALRTLVSGSRTRVQDGDVSLDLSYVTPRILAFSFPATGAEAFWRNSLPEVASFLQRRHGDRYFVLNLSEREYDASAFHHRVLELGFPDHHSPPLPLCWTLCLTMHSWLCADPLNVVAVHCLAGKGRTGVVIACYLLFSGALFAAPQPGAAFLLPHPAALADAALTLFAEKRGDAIKYASQKRVVRYFARVVHAAIVAEDARLKGAASVAGGSGSGGGGGGAALAPDALPAWEVPPEATPSGGEAVPLAEVQWAAVTGVRELRTLPLPLVTRVRPQRVVLAALFSRERVAELHEQGAFVPPRLRITTTPFQGGVTRTLYDSLAEGLGQGAIEVVDGDPLVINYHPRYLLLEGDVLLTLHTGEGGSGGGAKVLRSAFHTSFLQGAGQRAGRFRLGAKDVDQGKAARFFFPLATNFAIEFHYEVVAAGSTPAEPPPPEARARAPSLETNLQETFEDD